MPKPVKKKAKKMKEVKISKSDLKGYSMEEMETKFYGKKGTPKRDAYEKRIAKLIENDIGRGKAKKGK